MANRLSVNFFVACLSTALLSAISLNPLDSSAATPHAIDRKLDRIFIFMAIDKTGTALIVSPASISEPPHLYASVSISGLEVVRQAVLGSINPSLSSEIRLTPVTLKYYLDVWKNYRKSHPSILATIIPDTTERSVALRLLQDQGLTMNEAQAELGSDVPVFCPIPAVYAQDTNQTVHNRSTGQNFIPCSFSYSPLDVLIKTYRERENTSLVPLPLWKLIALLAKETEGSVNSIEILAHPTLVTGMRAANRRNHFTPSSLAGNQLFP